MIHFTKKFLGILLSMLTLGAYAQYSPQYQRSVSVTEPFGANQTNYPVLLIVDTQTPIAAGQMQAGGEDIRFSPDCYVQLYDYWIESGINTTATRIWVRIPALNANASQEMHMGYGDAAVTAISSFSATFPNALITSGNITLTGTQQPGWLQVAVGDTVFVTAGAALEIIAGYAQIDGVIMAQGSGHGVGALNTAGNGPGAGTSSGNSGSGGGSYGGVGGMGGLDVGDTPGNGGVVYGTLSGTDIDMGSSGGSGTTFGAAGGGSVTIKAIHTHVSGTINVKGSDAPGTASRGGGGGAGGGVLIMSDSIIVAGTINASGGNGGVGTSAFNDGGGGGAGGRTKLFTDAGLDSTGIVLVTGGAGGGFGDQASGQPGAAGTDYTGTWSFADPLVGTQESAYAIYAETVSGVCEGSSSITLAAGIPAGGTYSGTGVTGSMFDASAAGVGAHNIIYSYTDALGCTSADTSVITVNALPVVTYNETSTTVCEGSASITLTAGSPAGGTYSGVGITGNMFDALAAGTGSHYTIYSYTDGLGCASADTSIITVNALPVVTYTESTASICEGGAAFSLTAGSPAGGVYSGTGVTGSMFDPAVAGLGIHDIVYTYTDIAGCENTDTSQITVDDCTGITENAALQISIYPNPANDYIVISGSFNLQNNPTLQIYNTLGSLVVEKQIESNNSTLNISDLSAGVYSVILYTGYQYVKTTRLVIQK